MTDSETLAQEIRRVVGDASQTFEAGSDDATSRHPATGRWSAREILGHLIDSAAMNHRRFVVGQGDGGLVFDGYAQDDWVARQRYQEADWFDLVTLWRTYNMHLARIVSCIPEETLRRPRHPHTFDRIATRPVPADQSSTLGYLVEDYVVHLQHHIAQIRGLLAGGMP